MNIRVLTALLCVALGGCASITRGTTENISISSTPSGAEATIAGMEVPTACVTPCAVTVKRSDDITITFAKPGYESQVVPLTKEVVGSGAAGFAGNILVGGLVGAGVDAYNGAAMDHKPNPVIVTLQPGPPPAPPPVARRPPPRPKSRALPQAGT